VIDIAYSGTDGVEACLDRESWKTRVVLDAIQAFFGNGKCDLAILKDGRGSVRMEHVETENQHGSTLAGAA
jgi:hypothetical protein